MSEPDVRPEDALQVAQRALAKVNELESLEDDVADLEEELTAIKLRLSEIDEDRQYDSLTRDEKIGKVREHAFNRAIEGHGRAALDYHDIKWSVFEGEPGAAHCYDLMEWAADARGFEYRSPDGGNKELTVDAQEAKRGVAFFPRKKTPRRGRSKDVFIPARNPTTVSLSVNVVVQPL